MVKYISPVNILFVSKTSSRHLQDMSSRRLQDVFSVIIFCLPRRLEDVFKTSCEMSSRRLQDVFARRLQDVLKTSKCLLGRFLQKSTYENTKQKEGCSCNFILLVNEKKNKKQRILIYLTKTVPNRTSNAIFNMKKDNLDES